MKSQYQKQFLSEQKIRHKVLRALTHNKHQIRVNFSKSKAFKLLQMEINNKSNQVIGQPIQTNMENKNIDLKNLINENKFKTLDENSSQKSRHNDDLLEIVKRQNCKLAPMGWHQQKPLSRNNQISRSYRRKRRNSKLKQQSLTLEVDNKINQIDGQHPESPINKNCLSLSKYITISQDSKVTRKNSALTTINQTQDILKLRSGYKKPLFEYKYLAKRSGSAFNSSNTRQKLAIINQNQQKIQLNQQPISFLQLKRPAYTTIRKRFTSTGRITIKHQESSLSQLLAYQVTAKQDSCRPWTSRVPEQKVEEGKQAQLIQ